MTVAYQGTAYSGWQMQAVPGTPGLPTIQGLLEKSVEGITKYRIPIHGAGRTDAGVHAEGQVCHFEIPPGMEHIDWKQALNTQLPADIRITAVDTVPSSFHARRDSIGKRYAYSLWLHRDKAVPRIAPFVWSAPALDLERVQSAIPHLLGEHDFASFQNSGATLRSTVRTLTAIDLLPGRVAELSCPHDWPVLTLLFEGNGFLKQMVRNLTGLLVWIGIGKCSPEEIPAVLQAKNRQALRSPAAPAQGLTLLEVLY